VSFTEPHHRVHPLANGSAAWDTLVSFDTVRNRMTSWAKLVGRVVTVGGSVRGFIPGNVVAGYFPSEGFEDCIVLPEQVWRIPDKLAKSLGFLSSGGCVVV